MNIFALDLNPRNIPKHYCDKHVNKMLLETAQLLCSVHHMQYGADRSRIPYKLTHANHQCSVWARTNRTNYIWLLTLGIALATEYTERFGKRHKCLDVIMWAYRTPVYLPEGNLTAWPLAMPDSFKSNDVIASYRRYYAAKLRDFRKRGICKFTNTMRRSVTY